VVNIVFLKNRNPVKPFLYNICSNSLFPFVGTAWFIIFFGQDYEKIRYFNKNISMIIVGSKDWQEKFLALSREEKEGARGRFWGRDLIRFTIY